MADIIVERVFGKEKSHNETESQRDLAVRLSLLWWSVLVFTNSLLQNHINPFQGQCPQWLNHLLKVPSTLNNTTWGQSLRHMSSSLGKGTSKLLHPVPTVLPLKVNGICVNDKPLPPWLCYLLVNRTWQKLLRVLIRGPEDEIFQADQEAFNSITIKWWETKQSYLKSEGLRKLEENSLSKR